MILNMLLSASHYSLLLIGALFFFCILLCSWPLIGEAIYQNVVLVPADNWSELCTACASVLLFSLKLKYIWNLKQWQKNIKWEMERRAWDTGCDVWQSFAIGEDWRGKKLRPHSLCLGRLLWANQLALFCSLIVVLTNGHTEIWFDQSQVIHPDQSMMASSAISAAHTFYHHMCHIIALS